MRKSIMSASALLLLLGAVGCSKQQAVQEPSAGNFPADHVIRVSPTVTAETRGSYTTDNLARFDLLVEDSKGPAGKYTYSNTPFKKSEGGWTSDKMLLWRKSDDEVIVCAIAPSAGIESSVSIDDLYYSLFGVGFEVQAEQTKDDCSSDYLGWASGRKKVNELLTDGKLSFAFTHLLTHFTVTFKLGTEFNVSGVPAQDIISDVVVSGTARDFKLKGNVKDWSFAINPGTAASDIKPYNVGWTAAENAQGNCSSVYDCILVPQAVAKGGLKISFKAAGKNYEWVSAEKYTLNGNTAYTLTLKVGKDVVIAEGFSATEWKEGKGGSLYTE